MVKLRLLELDTTIWSATTSINAIAIIVIMQRYGMCDSMYVCMYVCNSMYVCQGIPERRDEMDQQTRCCASIRRRQSQWLVFSCLDHSESITMYNNTVDSVTVAESMSSVLELEASHDKTLARY
jgi:hypothetical protein